MLGYLGAVWRCRYFWLSLVKMDLRTRYRRSVLGMGWSLLHPIAMTIILCVAFSTVFSVSPTEYGPFVLAGLACWNFITTTTTQGCQCFFQGESYIRQYPSPLAIYPLRTALGGVIHLVLALSVVVGLSWYLHGFNNVPSVLTLFPTLVLLFVFGWSMAVLGGFANVYFQDTQHICEVGFQIFFYATPIMYQPSMLRGNALAEVLRYNPFVAFLELVRMPILEGRIPPIETYLFACGTVLVTTLAASLTLARLQRRLIFHL